MEQYTQHGENDEKITVKKVIIYNNHKRFPNSARHLPCCQTIQTICDVDIQYQRRRTLTY